MNSETYKKIHKQQVANLKTECERMVAEGTIVEERFNAEWMDDCDKYIAMRCRDMARNGLAQVLDEAVHQMAADYFNDELHGKWKGMKFEGLGDCKNEVEECESEKSENRTKVLETELANRNGELNLLREESLNKSRKIAGLEKDLKEAQKGLKSAQKEAEKARKEAEKARMAAEKAKPRESKASPEPVVDYDQIDMFAMAGV